MVRSEQLDALIVGGGPGGSTIAGCLAKRGRRVVVFERERFPRFHIGESLLPRSREVFEELGIDDVLDQTFLRKFGARFVCSRTGQISAYDFVDAFDPKYPYAYEVRRAEFDKLMLDNAARLGAEVREQWSVDSVVFNGTRAVGVDARPANSTGPATRFLAPMVVDCTGRDALMARRRKAKRAVPGLTQTAIFTHFRGAFRQSAQAQGNIQVVIFEHGWFWFIPFRGEVSSVGAVVSAEWIRARQKGESLNDFFLRTVELSSIAKQYLDGAEPLQPVEALADFSYRVDQLAGDGWLMVGDSSGFLDPLFSTGAHLAIKGGSLAAQAIDDALRKGDTSRSAFVGYESAVKDATDLFMGFVLQFYSGKLQQYLFTERQRPALRRLITSILSGDVFHDENAPTWVEMARRFNGRLVAGKQTEAAVEELESPTVLAAV